MTTTLTSSFISSSVPNSVPSSATGSVFTAPQPSYYSSSSLSAVLDLLDHSRNCLAEAASATTVSERYVSAHLAALRAAAAVLAARAKPQSSRGPRNVWLLLVKVAPEFAEWATFFAASAKKRAAAEAGLSRSVSAREADDLLRQSEVFLGLVAEFLGLPHQQSLLVAH